MPIQAVYKICDSAMPDSISLLTFQWLALGPNADLGLDKSPNQTKIRLSFMASLHTFFLQFIHSHTFKSSLSSANQLPKIMPVNLSSFLHHQEVARSSTRLRPFQRSKHQYSCILNRNTMHFQMPLKANKVTHLHGLYEQYDRKFAGGFQHTKDQNTQDPVLSSLTANYV